MEKFFQSIAQEMIEEIEQDANRTGRGLYMSEVDKIHEIRFSLAEIKETLPRIDAGRRSFAEVFYLLSHSCQADVILDEVHYRRPEAWR